MSRRVKGMKHNVNEKENSNDSEKEKELLARYEPNEALIKKADQLGKAGKAVNTLFSQPAQKGLTFALDSAVKAQTIGTKFSKVFGDMEESTKGWADNHATSLGKSVIDIQGYLTETHLMLTEMGATKKESADLSQKIVALGADYAAFHGKSDEDAISSLSMAIAGNAKEAEALGYKLNDADFGDGFADLSEDEKQLERFNEILKQSNEIQGYSQEAAGTFAGQLERLKAICQDVAAKFGEVLMPILIDVFTVVGNVVNWFGRLDDGWKIIIVGVGILVAAMGPLLMMMSNMLIISGALGVSVGWIFLIPAAIIGIVAVFGMLYKRFEGFRNAVQGFLSLFKRDTGGHQIMEDGYHGFYKGDGPQFEDDGFNAYHKGTNYHPGGLALVGERGPELLSLPKGSKVATNYRTERILNSSSNATIDGSLQSDISSSSISMPFAPQIIVNVEGREVNDSKTTLIKREVRDQILPMLEEYFSIMRLKHPILIER